MLLIVIGLFAACVIYVVINQWYRRPFLDDITSKTVFITGTDTGFGRELALSLDGKGLKVYAGCYTEHGAKELRNSASNRMYIFRIDVSKIESIKQAKVLIEKDLPPGQGIWGIVNNAGIHRSILFGFTTSDDFKTVLDVNFFGTVNINETFAPLVKTSKGRIVNIISILGRSSGAAEPYLCSKAALNPYNDGLRRWMRLFDVHVAAIEPGYFKTEMTKSSAIISDLHRTWERLPPDLKEECGSEFLSKYEDDITFWAKHPPLSSLNKTNTVIDAITHALLAKHPKSRYIVGHDALFLLRPLSYLPDWLIDIIAQLACPSLKLIRKRNQSNNFIKNQRIHLEN